MADFVFAFIPLSFHITIPAMFPQAVLVGSRKALLQRNGVLDTTHEILERLEAHLMASGQFTVQN